MDTYQYLNNISPETIENLYLSFKSNPESIDIQWKKFFEGFEFGQNNGISEIKPEILDKEFKVLNLIDNYRKRGHLFTKTNPVRTRRSYTPTLDITNFGLSESDLDNMFHAGNEIGIGIASLRQIVDHLQTTYCRSVGAEYMFIRTPEKLEWLTKRMESVKNLPNYSKEEKKQIYHYLKESVSFEKFIHKKFVGQKRFSLEGNDTLIPALHAVINRGAELGIDEFVIGMAHRGRLNVLANVMRKPYENIFKEFMGNKFEEHIVLGDVKYHLGYGNEVNTAVEKPVRLSMAPNPSHLETVAPIIQGIARARIDQRYHGDESRLCPIVMHGDAAVATQGVVYETIQMSELPNYRTGGTIHLVTNNQVGFTTNYIEARSSTYCTDIAKVTKSPIFHVNGDDVEAVMFAVTVAMEYRQIFHNDVFIDILGYRKYGHNEGDEPRFTQPTLYKIIEQHPNPRDIYADQLVEQGVFTREEIKAIENEFEVYMEDKLEKSKLLDAVQIPQFLKEDWEGFRYSQDNDFVSSPNTGIEKKKLIETAQKLNFLPGDKAFFSKTVKLIDDRKKLISDNKVDWALAEQLAYASISLEGHPVRLSGQDSVRGTFSHRHAAHTIEDTDQLYWPLKNLGNHQATVSVCNSPLSEYGVLGFEYGYALSCPKGLTLWEAQFGDFSNVAQVIIDQYISSAEEKWGLMNGLVLLLPHGYEGQGPEHSSARIERFLTLSANNNIQITNCTTPANFYHVLRRQVVRDFRIPLVVFTPKSLLRHPKCISTLDELANGRFQEVIDDPNNDPDQVHRLVFCSGKIYYDLLEQKEKFNARDIAIVRIEQLHPFPEHQIDLILKKYSKAVLHLWVQEEPENMGPWMYVNYRMRDAQLVVVSRKPSGSPAVGLAELHKIEQQEIISKVFRHCDCDKKLVYCGLQCVAGKSRIEILKQHNYLFNEKLKVEN